MTVRIATFNVENLMARFDFSGWRDELRRDRALAGREISSEAEYKLIEKARVIAHEDDARQMTALAIADCQADIVCLQEVEDLKTLEAFERNYLSKMAGLSYKHKIWKEGNDSRGIDVALMARSQTAQGEPIEIIRVKSHHKRTYAEMNVHTPQLAKLGVSPNARVFRRDCLEVNMRIGRKPITLFVTHFKSMGSGKGKVPGRDYTMPVREAEAKGVRAIIEKKFGADKAPKMRWMICGDLNDYSERLLVQGEKSSGYSFEMMTEQNTSLSALMDEGFAENLVSRRATNNRWTLHYAEPLDPKLPDKARTNHLVQLDYLLASKALAATNKNVLPDIIRNGLPHRTIFPVGQDVERYPRIGWDRPKASDHCPVAVTLKMV